MNLVTSQVYGDTSTTWLPQEFIFASTGIEALTNYSNVNIEHFCALVVHPVTWETITQYKKLQVDPLLHKLWGTAWGKEFGNMAQGNKLTNTPGKNSIFVMSHDEIGRIPEDCTVTYAKIVVNFRPQKADPNQVRITVGGNLINYPHKLTTRTANLTTFKVIWNRVLSTENAHFMGINIKNFYPRTPLDRYKYMKIPIVLSPQHTIEQYNLLHHVKGGYVYLKIQKAIYGLPQAGILANKQLWEKLEPAGYYEVAHTLSLLFGISLGHRSEERYTK